MSTTAVSATANATDNANATANVTISVADLSAAPTTSAAPAATSGKKYKKKEKPAPAAAPQTPSAPAADEFDNECQVCCEKLNKSTNKPIICPFGSCSYSACVSCIRNYLVTNPLSPPHCMACKKQFNYLFLVENLTKVWTQDKYKKHVSDVMVDIELSKLSESMPEAENRKKIADIHKQIDKLNEAKIKKVKEHNEIIRIQFDDPIREYVDQLNILRNKSVSSDRKSFIMPCSYNNCKGMLSTQYKCGLCDKFTCKDCQEPKEDEHKCNPDNLATAQFIKKDTKPCPSCATRIFKIEGCDQMWCTNCKTPFSWTTCKIVPVGQQIHNPHAIEFFKKNGVNVRAPGDLLCGGLISHGQLIEIEKTIKYFRIMINSISVNKNINQTFLQYFPDINMKINCPPAEYKNPYSAFNPYDIFDILLSYLHTAYIISREVNYNKLRESREIVQAHTDFNEERVLFILNQLDKEKFSENIKKQNQNKSVHLELSFIWEILSNFSIDMFTILYSLATKAKDDASTVVFFKMFFQKLSEFSSLINYVNSQLAIVSVSHSCSVPIIDFHFNISSPEIFRATNHENRYNNWLINAHKIPLGGDRRLLFLSQKFSNSMMKATFH